MTDSESKPFGTMPDDAEIAGFFLGFGGWIFGLVMGAFLRAAKGETLPFSSSPTPWWFQVVLVTVVAVVSFRVRDWILRASIWVSGQICCSAFPSGHRA
jgi:hypothetical protein